MNPAWMLSDEDREERKRRRHEANTNKVGVVVKKVDNTIPDSGSTNDIIASSPTQVVFDVDHLLQMQRIVGGLEDKKLLVTK